MRTYHRNTKRTYTTIGDLIVAAVDAALEISGDERKAYQITGVVLDKMLRAPSRKSDRHNVGFYNGERLR